nr:hypothetical protein [Tanacetum cinerariifolium]
MAYQVYFTSDHNNSRQNTSLSSFSQELLEFMDVHDNDASESSQPSWGRGKLIQKLHQKGVYEESFSRHDA